MAALPLTPPAIASRMIDRFHDKRRARATNDPVWADIERRRQNPNGTTTFLSDDLTWQDWQTQRRIERHLTPEPRWLPAARRVSSWKLGSITWNVTQSRQRVERGWSDSDAADTGHHLVSVTAAMLEHLADNMHGWAGQRRVP